jgi:flavin-dependent dehydrogenase
MVDAIVVGAGPAGSVAALTMARAGARVLIVDRATFPRDTLCGDVIRAPVFRELDRLGLARPQPEHVIHLRGWRLSAPCAGTRVLAAREAAGDRCVAMARRYFDAWLLEAAIHAGARFEPGWRVRHPLIDHADGLVRGVAMERRDGSGGVRMPAHMVIAADGRRSILARQVGVHVPSPVRQRATGVYVRGITDVVDLGEIHLGAGAYCGVTPAGDEGARVWVVHHDARHRDPHEAVRQFLSRHGALRARSTQMVFAGDAHASGVVGGQTRAAGVAGLLLAGDAAGFVEPLGDDGIHRAVLGGRFAADETLRALESGDFAAAVTRLDAARRAEFDATERAAHTQRWVARRQMWLRAAGVLARLSPDLLGRLTIGASVRA